MKASHRLTVLALVLFLCGAPGCPHQKWQGPSTHYRAMDRINRKDGQITRAEWEAAHSSCLQEGQAVCAWMFTEYLAEFSCMDADRSGTVRWSEYYDFRFTRKVECPLWHGLMKARPTFDQQGNFRL